VQHDFPAAIAAENDRHSVRGDSAIGGSIGCIGIASVPRSGRTLRFLSLRLYRTVSHSPLACFLSSLFVGTEGLILMNILENCTLELNWE
jgi:hypothetical protein